MQHQASPTKRAGKLSIGRDGDDSALSSSDDLHEKMRERYNRSRWKRRRGVFENEQVRIKRQRSSQPNARSRLWRNVRNGMVQFGVKLGLACELFDLHPYLVAHWFKLEGERHSQVLRNSECFEQDDSIRN
jgi:hypothetical protein